MYASDRSLPDISGGLAWNLALKTTYTAADAGNGRHYPIPDKQVAITSSRVVLVGIAAPEAPAHYWLGGYAAGNSFLTPDSQTNFVGLVNGGRMALRRDRLTLFAMPKYLPLPWVLVLSFPRWHRVVNCEVYWYDGADLDISDLLP